MHARLFMVLALALFIAFPSVAQELDIRALSAKIAAEIAASRSQERRSELIAASAAEPGSEGAEGLALAMLVNRHLEESVYFYALAAQRDPGNAAILTSLGAAAGEMLATGGELASAGHSELVALQRAALRLEPDDPSIKHNLATALQKLATPDALEEARRLLEEARAADPGNGLTAARLVDVLMELGLEDLARQVLESTVASGPGSAAVMVANARYFGGQALQRPPELCTVDFQCSRICPGGIIGRINYVTCEMSNASAVSACQAGQPYPQSYNCDAQMPRFGILIPGLDPGFSILTPWGSIDILVQGDGRLQAKIGINGPALQGPLKSLATIQGTYDPSRGELQVKGSGGVTLGIPSTKSAATEYVKEYGLAPDIRIEYNAKPDAGQPEIEPSVQAFRGKVMG